MCLFSICVMQLDLQKRLPTPWQVMVVLRLITLRHMLPLLHIHHHNMDMVLHRVVMDMALHRVVDMVAVAGTVLLLLVHTAAATIAVAID